VILRQIAERQQRLLDAAADEPELVDFMARLREERDRRAPPNDVGLADQLAPQHRTLSPSDFGFHNALRDRSGHIVFLDFEYFGWDDPVKLTADFILHPGMMLDGAARRRFAAGMAELHASDPDSRQRLRRHLPLIALRWCLILLNEFLPGHWARRMIAGGSDRMAAKASQLAKAKSMLGAIDSVVADLP